MSAGARLFKAGMVSFMHLLQSHARYFKRLNGVQELKEVSKLSKTDTGIELRPDENNIYAWKGFLQVQTFHSTQADNAPRTPSPPI